ncbi:ABC-type glycerol-3-phosphate transport system permease component [Rhizobium sp. SG_E_25_P2]|jgi:ABC-type glycerol-3-phosphate transport system permease component|uniref:carbohydrate ABC transporter permease n=1 Tax=Rhizobium sp. SG_E_25_P2 TaxID=2879942 RepID=UPI0024766967|nr:carbohydrate ABC transporter permease [Rhizobium sp. SG_E_25_P2]MDH6268730.1 ABC-type glycerol-3-phosphate transport system permease component [Rhizobium sp. SG_E_25_P2]
MAISGKREKTLLRLASIPMWALALTCLYPIYFAVNNALKTDKGYILNRFSLVNDPTIVNFINAWNRSKLSEYFLNSVVTTFGAVALLLLVSSLAGFAFAMLRFPYRKLLFMVVLASLMIPVQVVLVPFYRTIVALDLVNTRIGLIISYTAFFLPFCVYLMTAFYSGLPRELVEAARMDGAKLLQIWWHVMLPLGRPALITLGILNTLYCWNDVLISLLVLQKDRTLMVGIAALKGEYTTNVPLLMAGIVIAAAPIVLIYLVFQRRIVNGIATGAVKG